jgi:hypothetical protein
MTVIACTVCAAWVSDDQVMPEDACSWGCAGAAQSAKGGSPVALRTIERSAARRKGKKKLAKPQPSLFDLFKGGGAA